MEKKASLSVHLPGGLWAVAWLFTIGFAHLSFWKSVAAIVIWPYFIGIRLSALL